MTEAWVGHIKTVQQQYKAQGTPISYHQAMVVAKRTWPQVKAGEKPTIKVESDQIPQHNTKPREARKPPPRSSLRDEREYEEPPRKAPLRRPPRDEYEYEEPVRRAPPQPRKAPPRRAPPPRDEYEYSGRYLPDYDEYYPPQPRGRGRPPRRDNFRDEYEEY